ncbi:peptidase [Candidatus Chloroploca sp. Khr17]|uniref:peptidase n=1 Tax=Candidatus Chloroploca sp. Khr17 TaxID=2496869 RepID=UPI00101C7355|nr:peptidase [Candidatus Chloroploca sp. Khr17]
MPRQLIMLLLMALLVAPLGRQPTATALAEPVEVPAAMLSEVTKLPPYIEQEAPGTNSNDRPQAAESIGDRTLQSWEQTITGVIDRSTDVDFFRMVVARPASRIQIVLDGLPADYDLVFGGGPDPEAGIDLNFDPGVPGLEGITQVGGSIGAIGGSIGAIGGSIGAIGGSIGAIGGSIGAIGGSIGAIGGSIGAISINSGRTPETIDTLIWVPGVYYVVVVPHNGADPIGDTNALPYRLGVRLDGSELTIPPSAPEVELRLDFSSLPGGGDVRPEQITTLYIHHPQRLAQIYGPDENPQTGTISSIGFALDRFASSPPQSNGAPPEYGIVLDLGRLEPMMSGRASTATITDVYDLWDANQGNPLYASYVAGLIDNLIEAATQTTSITNTNAEFYYGNAAEDARITFPNVRNIVLIGGDNIVPFFRVPDLTTIANEADYLAYTRDLVGGRDMLIPDSALGAALRYRMLLTDSPYGAGRPYRFYGYPFHLPQLAVGRIVETPKDIANYLNAQLDGSEYTNRPSHIDVTSQGDGQPGPARASVTGYDFLTDQAQAVTSILTTTRSFPQEVNSLINDRWTRPDLERTWFDGRLDTDFPLPQDGFVNLQSNPLALNSVNAHFDHWQLLPAVEDRTGNFPAERLLVPEYEFSSPGVYFMGTLGYSVGCHSGYNVHTGALAEGMPLLYRADFAEALNRHGGNWIGNTGYGYGTTDGIDYSERLSVLLTEELARKVEVLAFGRSPAQSLFPIGPTIGEALVKSKQRYVRNSTTLSAYDYKAISIMTLYGLPFIRVQMENPLPPPLEDPSPTQTAPLEINTPIQPDRLGRLTRTITFTIDLSRENFVPVLRTGSTILRPGPESIKVEDSFGEAFVRPPRLFENNQIAVPVLPNLAYDISALSNGSTERLRVRDVVMIGGIYDEREGFDPQITQVVTETSSPIIETDIEPAFPAGIGIWFPDKMFAYSTVGEGELQRDQLVTAIAQFRTSPGGKIGTLRPYRQLVFQVFYEDPDPRLLTGEILALRSDTMPPIIESVAVRSPDVNIELAQATEALVEIQVRDISLNTEFGRSGIANVSMIYIGPDGRTWENRALEQTDPGSGIYQSIVPIAPGDLRIIARATDRAGNTSHFTFKGTFTPLSFERYQVFLPSLQRSGN